MTQATQQYALGPVTALVERVAYILGPMFGITTIYGHRAVGSVPDSDHPKGKALDFMVPNLAVGESLARFAAANAGILGVKYIVWNRRSWNPQRGTWVPYTSTSNPHTDHVHVSFKDSSSNPEGLEKGVIGGMLGGVFGPPVATGVQTVPDVGEIAGNVLDPWGILSGNLLKPDFWRRIGTGVIGGALIIAGLLFIARRPIGTIVGGVGGAVGDLAGTAIQGWAFGLGAGTTGAVGRAKPVSSAPGSSVPVTVPNRPGPRPPAINPPSNAPTTSVLPPEIYAPVSPGGTYQVTAVGRAENPTEYRRPKGGSLIDLAGQRNPAPKPRKKGSKKGTHGTSVSAPMRQQPYGGQ